MFSVEPLKLSLWLLLKINSGWLGYLILHKKITSWACLEGSGLKLSFHWYAQLFIFSRSLFKAITDKSVSWTTENREVSSAKSLGFYDKSFDKLLMKIKNNKGPGIGPCGTPALTAAHL